jgi:hypothetical protein
MVTRGGRSAGDGWNGGRKSHTGVFVVAVADVATLVLLVGTAVYDALGIMGVPISGGESSGLMDGTWDMPSIRNSLWCTSGAEWFRRIGHVDEDQSRSARVLSRRGSNRDGIVEFLVDDDVVCWHGGSASYGIPGALDSRGLTSANGQVVKETGEIGPGVERFRRAGIEVEEFPHVEDLNVMVDSFRPDDEVVAIRFELTPITTWSTHHHSPRPVLSHPYHTYHCEMLAVCCCGKRPR